MGAITQRIRISYETDFAAWAFEQAAAVRRRDWDALDVPNLVEELQSMGRQQRAELRNRLAVLLMHLAKWQAQPAERGGRGRSRRATIDVQRIDIAGHLADNPSLQPYVPEAMVHAWKVARITAAGETGLPRETFAMACPYAWEQVMDADWLPE